MRIRVWSPVQVVPDVTGTKKHTEQMFVWTLTARTEYLGQQNETLNMKGHQKRGAIYVQITVSLRLCRALLSTNGQGKPRRPGGLESDSRCCRGVSRESCRQRMGKNWSKNPKKSESCTQLKKQMAVGDLFEMFEKHKSTAHQKSWSHYQQP